MTLINFNPSIGVNGIRFFSENLSIDRVASAQFNKKFFDMAALLVVPKVVTTLFFFFSSGTVYILLEI